MKISQIIAEEVGRMLAEVEGADVATALSKIEELPDDVAHKMIAKLEPHVRAAVEKVGDSSGSVTEGDEEKPGTPIGRAAATGLLNIPGGLDLGAMYLASIDRKTPPTLRVAFLIAVANLLSPIDVGTLFGMDWLGPLMVLDDYVLVKKLIINKYREAGFPKEEHYDRMQELAGQEIQNPESTPQQVGRISPSGESRPPREGPAKAWRKAQRAKKGGEEELQELKIKTSQLYKIIQEELEVVLTNEEAEEMFDLDMSALLDEMMNEEEMRSAKGNVTQAARKKHATLSDGRFPIFDDESAQAALKLRGHDTTAAERKKIINKAAEYVPEAAEKAREEDKKKD